MDITRWLKCQWDRAAAVIAALLGVISILLGWNGVRHSGLPAEQIPYLASGAVLGLFALGIAATLWLSADLRDEWRKLEEIRGELKRIGDGGDQELAAPAPPAAAPASRRASRRGRLRATGNPVHTLAADSPSGV